MKHSAKSVEGVRYDWPFYKMMVGDHIILNGKDENEAKRLRTRAMSATSHYKRTRGFQFKSVRIERQPNTFAIIRVK